MGKGMGKGRGKGRGKGGAIITFVDPDNVCCTFCFLLIFAVIALACLDCFKSESEAEICDILVYMSLKQQTDSRRYLAEGFEGSAEGSAGGLPADLPEGVFKSVGHFLRGTLLEEPYVMSEEDSRIERTMAALDFER
mmetsp:Transcript_8025/g.19099  ORF Transcript_8025/g.19099 Transcript_8025/m.19099 type:complete len:137 (+) Transcript_8025:209-619(+)